LFPLGYVPAGQELAMLVPTDAELILKVELANTPPLRPTEERLKLPVLRPFAGPAAANSFTQWSYVTKPHQQIGPLLPLQ